MKPKNIFFLLFLLVIFWLIYFRLKPANFSLIFDLKQPTPVSPLYYVKSLRQQIQSIFIMGDRDLAEWNFTLSQKRLSEAQILCQHNLTKLGQKQLLLSQKYYQKGNFYLNNLIDKVDTNYLLQEKLKIETLTKTSCK